MRPGKPAEQQLDRGGMWKFWRVTESAVRGIERPPDAIDAGGEQRWIERPGARWRVTRGELTVQLRGGVPGLVPALAVVLRHAQQDACEARPAEGVHRREVGAAEKDLAVRREEAGQRPAALPADSADRVLVAGVEIGPFVAVDLDGDEVLVDDGRHCRVVVTLMVQHMAPVTPHGPDVEQNRFVLARRPLECFPRPRIPVHGLVRGGTQIRALFGGEAILNHD